MYRLLMLHNFFAAPLLLLWPFSVRGWPLHKFIVCVQCVTVRALLEGGAGCCLSARRETLFRLCFVAVGRDDFSLCSRQGANLFTNVPIKLGRRTGKRKDVVAAVKRWNGARASPIMKSLSGTHNNSCLSAAH